MGLGEFVDLGDLGLELVGALGDLRGVRILALNEAHTHCENILHTLAVLGHIRRKLVVFGQCGDACI
jgi:hypothetical protein